MRIFDIANNAKGRNLPIIAPGFSAANEMECASSKTNHRTP